ncbi:MAG TPA: hypothetical protein VGM32_01820 [Rhodopila sp.]|jgi:hypothetical protein
MQEPAGKEGIAGLMHGLFEYGTEARDRIAFHEAVDAIVWRLAGSRCGFPDRSAAGRTQQAVARA